MAKKKAGRRTKKEEKQLETWTDKISGVDAPSKPYSIKAKYDLNDLIDHPKFGAGVVSKLMGESKIEVTFSDGIKNLIHNK